MITPIYQRKYTCSDCSVFAWRSTDGIEDCPLCERTMKRGGRRLVGVAIQR